MYMYLITINNMRNANICIKREISNYDAHSKPLFLKLQILDLQNCSDDVKTLCSTGSSTS